MIELALVGDPVLDVVPVEDRAGARVFVDAHIAPLANEFERTATVPETVLDALSRAGLWAPFLPTDLGGRGVDMVTLGAIHEEVGRGCSSVRSLLTVHTMVAWVVNRWGTPDQRHHWVPRLADGSTLGAFCLTEPGAGSNAADIATVAEQTPDGWRLNGTKRWITNGRRADVFLVFARTGATIVGFLVPRSTPGLEVSAITEVLGTRGSMLAEVRLRDVALPDDALVGPRGFTAGMVLTSALDLGRFSVANGCVGLVQACLDASTSYALERRVGGTALWDLPLIRSKISDMVTDVRAARLLCTEAGRLKDAGDPATVMATWIAKYFASVAAARHASEAVQIHGANGFGPDHPVARLYRDAKVMEVIEGSNEIQRLTIADEALRGLAGSPS
ncbi:acyl-CoA dehydrogenase family protein [Nocardioides sp. GXZ039]|uniref:acyl-CoA dehydrogenase family protein n=1 Tax=Nocardioides sp. GXZ039 TaxID=3136018 RepID=UPI0030F3ADFD